jgi:hypothetical protein
MDEDLGGYVDHILVIRVRFQLPPANPLARKSLWTVLLDPVTAEVLGFLPID